MQPKIQIFYNRFLDPIFIEYCKHHPKWKDWVPPPIEDVKNKVAEFKDEWKKYEQKIMEGINKCAGLSFKRNIIDVHVVSGNPRQFSRPIVIKSTFDPESFVDTLTHELIHVLFSDNSKIVKTDIYSEQLYPNESETTRKHIIVHAILKYIYLDILNQKHRLERNIQSSGAHSTLEYKKAWEIVESKGYQNIISEFRKKITASPIAREAVDN